MTDQNGVSDSTHSNSVAPEPTKVSDVVKYETYSRVLSEAKKLKEKVREYETHLERAKEQQLQEQNQWKALAEQYKAKLEQTSSAFQEQEKSIINGLKYQEFEKHLGGKLKKSDYASFVDFERIIFNPETKQPDPESARAVASEFVKEHSSLVDFYGTAKLPNQAASNFTVQTKSVGSMTKAELEQHLLELAKLGKIK